MKPIDRQKMCTNCDGRIPYEATQCPYCFAEQRMEPSTQAPASSLYPPPYSAKPQAGSIHLQEASEDEASKTSPLLSIFMLTLGSNLVTLGILQFLFSDHGILRLEMSTSYWFLMALVGSPLIYFGLKQISPASKD